MPSTGWTRRAIVGCGVAGVAALMTTVIAPAAAADEAGGAPGYAPITLSPREARQLCEEYLPRLEDRAATLSERINGGPEVRGSVAWLKAHAQTQRSKGHTRAGDRLDQRAERRAARIDDLNAIQQRLRTFASEHCRPVA